MKSGCLVLPFHQADSRMLSQGKTEANFVIRNSLFVIRYSLFQ